MKIRNYNGYPVLLAKSGHIGRVLSPNKGWDGEGWGKGRVDSSRSDFEPE